jgi:integrating conjugative element membrane protein (TIGR03745 family)
MYNIFKKSKKKIASAKIALSTIALLGASTVHAALPATAAPSNAAAAGDYIGLIKGYAFDIAIVLGLILGTIAFLTVSKNMVAVYAEIGAGKKTWGDMGMHGGMGVLLLVMVIYLITEASTVIF